MLKHAPVAGPALHSDPAPTFDLTSRDLLLTVFFTTVGLSARISMLRASGITLVVLTACAVVNLVMQNTLGVGLMTLLGLPPAPRLPWPAGTSSLALIAEIALGLFLAMSLMSLNLTTLADAALPLLVVLTVQVATCGFLLSVVVFRLLGAPTMRP